eukprot:scaffold31776_cov73-Phaeocystis_antarctica.AAC.4
MKQLGLSVLGLRGHCTHASEEGSLSPRRADDGGGGEGLGGCSQTYFLFAVHPASFHKPPYWLVYFIKQFSCVRPLGSPAYQLVYDSGVLDGLHTHVPSDAASVPPIHTVLPAAAVSSSASCAADCTVANWRPAAWQSALASAHERASLMSV